MKKKMVYVLLSTMLMATVLSGCGKTEINVLDEVAVEFDGVNGYGTARISDEGGWEEQALTAAGLDEKTLDDEDAVESLRGIYAIEEAVEYSISPKENLSNGDTVTIIAKVDNESVDDYKIKFVGGEMKVTVEGLKEVEQVDLFEGVDVEFQGTAPYVKASISTQNANREFSVNYSIDKSENLMAGDTVTVTAEYNEENLLQKGYVAVESTKEFVVPESDRYVTNLAEIPADVTEKINKQFEDAFRAYVANSWKMPESLRTMEPIGEYLLTLKAGGNMSFSSDARNIYYGVYKINAETAEGPMEFYSYIQYKNTIVLKDGTCSLDLTDYKMPKGSAFSKKIYSGEGFWAGDYFYLGYEELDSLFNNCVTSYIEKYEYESSVTE